MKVLIIGKRGGILQWYEHFLDAGEGVPDVEIKGFGLNHNNLFERLSKKITGQFSNDYKDSITARALATVMQDFQPHLVVVTDMFYFSKKVLNVFRAHKSRCNYVHWIGDFFKREIFISKEIFDHYYFTDTALVEQAKSMGLANSSYLPLAYNPTIFYPAKNKKIRSKKLLFIGAWSANREALIKEIDVPMLIIGKGWNKHNHSAHNVISKNIPLVEVANLYQAHSFVLNIINSNNIKNGLNMRCFEAPACQALLITDQVADLHLCYQKDKEVFVYQSAQDISKFLTFVEDNHYKEIITQGYDKVSSSHTYRIRLEKIMREYPKKGAKPLDDLEQSLKHE